MFVPVEMLGMRRYHAHPGSSVPVGLPRIRHPGSSSTPTRHRIWLLVRGVRLRQPQQLPRYRASSTRCATSGGQWSGWRTSSRLDKGLHLPHDPSRIGKTRAPNARRLLDVGAHAGASCIWPSRQAGRPRHRAQSQDSRICGATHRRHGPPDQRRCAAADGHRLAVTLIDVLEHIPDRCVCCACWPASRARRLRGDQSAVRPQPISQERVLSMFSHEMSLAENLVRSHFRPVRCAWRSSASVHEDFRPDGRP
jgi:hypothetical protein